MKITYNKKAQGSAYDPFIGLDFLRTGLTSTVRAGTRSGIRFTGVDSALRMTEISRARDLANLSPTELEKKYNPTRGQTQGPYDDPYQQNYDDPGSIPRLEDFSGIGFSGPIKHLSADEANDVYGLGGHLQFQDGVSNLEAYILNDRKKKEISFNYALQQAEGATFAAGFTAQMAAALLDPVGVGLGILSAPVGTYRLQKALNVTSKSGKRLITGSLGGFYGSTAIEPIIYSAAKQEQAEYSAVDSLINVTFGTFVGGGLHVVGGKIGDTIKGKERARHVEAIKTAIHQAEEGENVEVSPIINGGEQGADEIPSLNLGEEAPSPQQRTETETQAAKQVFETETFAPHSDVDASLAKIESKQAGGKLTGFSFKKLFNAVTQLKEAYDAGVKAKQKQFFAFKIKDSTGRVILIKKQVKKGEPLRLFDTSELNISGIKIEEVGEKVHQALLMHGVDPLGSTLAYQGSYKFDSDGITHVMELDGAKFDPEMNQKNTVLVSPEKAYDLFNNTAMKAVFSEGGPKGKQAVRDALQTDTRKLTEPLPEDLITYSGVDEALNTENLKQIGEQQGTMPGGMHVDVATGDRYYVKYSDDQDALINEFVAATLYRMAGVDFPINRLVVKDGKVVGVGSKFIDNVAPELAANVAQEVADENQGAPPLSFDELMKLPDLVKQRFVEDMIVDMYLGNWDVIGNPPNWNIYKKANGTVGRLDAGGSLFFRAQGGDKALSGDFPEFNTFFDPKVNPYTAELLDDVLSTAFGFAPKEMDKVQKKAAFLNIASDKIRNILQFDDADINKLAEISGFSDPDELSSALLNRQATLSEKLNIQAPAGESLGFSKMQYKYAGKRAVKKKNKLIIYTKKDALAYLEKKGGQQFKNLSREVKQAVGSYGDTGYKLINQYLYGNDIHEEIIPKLKERIQLIDQAMQPLDRPIQLYKGGVPFWGFKPKGLELKNNSDIETALQMKGGTFSLPAFQSTTLNRAQALAWQMDQSLSDTIVFSIEAPAGTKAIYGQTDVYQSLSSEVEITLARDLVYRVKKVDTVHMGSYAEYKDVPAYAKRLLVTLEVVPPGQQTAPKVTPKLAIKIAKAHKSDSSSAVNDADEPIRFEDEQAVQATLKPDELQSKTSEVEQTVEDLMEEIEADLVNMDDDLLAGFAAEIDEINKAATADIALAKDLHKAAKAAAMCVRGAS